MAKGIYIGGSAPKITSVNITASNISTYFAVTNDTYYFSGSGSVFTTNNGGAANSTAKTTLTAKQNISNITFTYSYSSEANYDKFTLTVAGTTVENAVSGATTTKSYSGTLSTGDTIIFQYAKDVSANSNDDKCTFSNMVIGISDGTTIDNVARKVKQSYVGVDGVSRRVKSGYVSADNVVKNVFRPSVVWKKYNATLGNVYVMGAPYTVTNYNIVDSYTSGYTTGYAETYSSYTFSSTDRFKGVGEKSTAVYGQTVSELNSELEGRYYVSSFGSSLIRITAVTSIEAPTDSTSYYTARVTGECTPTTEKNAYLMGSTSYGEITVPEGQLPEEGTLIEGSADDNYCVLQVNGIYYYYEKA